MKTRLLSKLTGFIKKIKFFQTPTFLILIFLLTLILTEVFELGRYKFYLLPILLVLAISSIFLSKRILVCNLMIILGFCFPVVSNELLRQTYIPGCYESEVRSESKVNNKNQEFLVNDEKGQNLIVKTDDPRIYSFGDRLMVCSDSSEKLSNKDAKYYLSKYKTDQVIKPQIEFIESSDSLIRHVLFFKNTITAKIMALFQGDAAILAQGLWLGGTQNFSDQLKINLKLTGTSHLVAVSGYNVSILTIIIFGFLRNFISKRFAFYSSLILLTFFYLITGGQASVLRASIMGVLVLSSKMIGRKTSIIHLLVLAASIMLLQNPYAIFDKGFQLSFAATFGLVYLGEPISEFLSSKIKVEQVKGLVQIISQTIAAQLFVLPIILGIGPVSIISPIVNVLILPFVPFEMFLIFLSVSLGFLSHWLGIFVAGFAEIFLEYFIFIINQFSKIKYGAFEFKNATLVSIAIYLALVLLVKVLLNKIRHKNA